MCGFRIWSNASAFPWPLHVVGLIPQICYSEPRTEHFTDLFPAKLDQKNLRPPIADQGVNDEDLARWGRPASSVQLSPGATGKRPRTDYSGRTGWRSNVAPLRRIRAECPGHFGGSRRPLVGRAGPQCTWPN
jgi:hypothetical protein